MRLNAEPLILDTDIGPDVDDAGALALLHILMRTTPRDVLAITHCTSNPYGAGCIDAIDRFYGREIPVGTLDRPGFLTGPEHERYNREICLRYPNRYPPGAPCPSATGLLTETLAGAGDGSVDFLAIGPLTNLSDLLDAPGGRDLVRRKVRRLVAMAAATGDLVEWNVKQDLAAARNVFLHWPTPIVLSPMETGVGILTARSFGTMSPGNPVRVAYGLYSPEGRMSWDLTVVWYALRGVEPFFRLSAPMRLTLEEDGRTRFAEDPAGRFRLLENQWEPEAIGRALDALWED